MTHAAEAEPHVQRNPEVGMLAIVRNRRGTISEVREFDGHNGRLHVVRVDYKDEGRPMAEEVVWELEPFARVLEPHEIPQATNTPMPPEDFDALVRAARWSAITPYLDPDHLGPLDRQPISSPFHGSIQVDNYQLIPLLKALRMPRVNLFIADDVGLGKTVEAGLILSELLIRRRVNRILILTPASLRIQWKEELDDKFSLPFDVIDKEFTLQLKRILGIDANPWRCSSRAIASYHYLRQPDVLADFLSASQVRENSAQLPWDLLVVDEVHNLMPSVFGDDSQLCNMLRLISPYFEHRIFLTATPHNGHTRAFTGLLEMLDPVRFSRTDELPPAQRERVRQVVIRRLKSEINKRTSPPRFCNRLDPESIPIEFASEERLLVDAFDAFREKVRELIAQSDRKRRLAGRFAIEVLGKRLLSGPVTFLESWRRSKMGLHDEDVADDTDVIAAGKTAQEETSDDREAEQRGATAAGVIGAWLKPMAEHLQSEIAALDAAANALKISLADDVVLQNPKRDARLDALIGKIESLLRADGAWRDDERLVVFTEYKTTLDYLMRRLRTRYPKDEVRFLSLYGGMGDVEREEIKSAFNDPEAPVRVLLATDAASEGLNLQSTARYLLHYDCPWNPARLEQRNGRLDRHGQACDVQIFHFISERDADLRFLAYLIRKVHQIREDLGATGELFDEATHRRLVQGESAESVQASLELDIAQAQKAARIDADDTVDESRSNEDELGQKLQAMRHELDLDAKSGRETLDVALAIGNTRPLLTDPDELDRFSLVDPNLPGWKDTIDETIRRNTPGKGLGPVPRLTFSAKPFMTQIGPREVFRPRVDTMMLHLGHPLVQRATGRITRCRFPGDFAVSRWAWRVGEVPEGADALILFHIEELAVNELRETFHHWIRTMQIPVKRGALGNPLPHRSAFDLRGAQTSHDDTLRERARDVLEEADQDLRKLVRDLKKELTKRLTDQLEDDRENTRAIEEENFRSRQGEVSTLIAENTLAKIEKEIAQLKAKVAQQELFDDKAYVEDLEHTIRSREEEVARRRRHYEEVRDQLSRERDRILNQVIPRRYALLGEAQVFPLAVEVRLPKAGAR